MHDHILAFKYINLIDDNIYKVISLDGKYYQLYVPWTQLIFFSSKLYLGCYAQMM